MWRPNSASATPRSRSAGTKFEAWSHRIRSPHAGSPETVSTGWGGYGAAMGDPVRCKLADTSRLGQSTYQGSCAHGNNPARRPPLAEHAGAGARTHDGQNRTPEEAR